MNSNPKRIYLAGKITGTNWRRALVSPCYALNFHPHMDDCRWGILPRAIHGKFDYVGPFTMSDQHGATIHESCEATFAPQDITSRCVTALSLADLVFAWIDSPDAYGTLVEIGIAYGMQGHSNQSMYDLLGEVAPPRHLVAITRPPESAPCEDDLSELWFAFHLPNIIKVVAKDPTSALDTVLNHLGWMAEWSSPLEEMFWCEWHRVSDMPLAPQHKVLNGKYRLDFAHLPSRTAIECDGWTYHQSKFQSDRQRDRELMMAGWRVIRFTGDELRSNLQGCVQQVVGIISHGQS